MSKESGPKPRGSFKLSPRQSLEQIPTTVQISNLAKKTWQNFPWDEGQPDIFIDKVYQIFKKKKFKVSVEHFRPFTSRWEREKNFFVIAQDDPAVSKGIVVPRYGLTFDRKLDVGLFNGESEEEEIPSGTQITSSNLAEFPKVERRRVEGVTPNVFFWYIQEIGKLKKES